ncbi:endonuclease/exonuclease/phosphatase family protein [Pseudomonas nunensis]|uniref:Endonuclease/exonuclease/phosphatase family protein n=1 Tax=Pseudomonas nunensis TaxID=2961896 RepID=A0ABY5E994_9PSED|nr:endonuclease/exonuclease/phosphatase family protein [Pseudomonas nunensis]KPN91690.1 hypothetical protein AL066_15650 [Pseudomonas nunensis]MCL5229614.1 endonuclease/exonuclease/phosphatase family protein [Pseudomonas nunensis]UTO11894.1 endonuclease/exonuclease/phosphatase family protein [Pseudomonas nunensis]
MDSQADQVIFAWWNTSLAPSAKSRSTPEQKAVACSVILYLIQVGRADFIALGEMSTEDFAHVSEVCQVEGYAFATEITSVGRSSFDICYIYNCAKIFVYSTKDIVTQKGGSTLKVAKKMELVVAGATSFFHVYISHWPSRLWCQQNDANRHLLGIRLRDSIDAVIEDDGENPFVILLGDYNDEPFDESLSQQVMATRDVDLVHKREHLFYNPFWKYLCKTNSEHPAAGSYYYKSGEITRWHTFDQLIFSHAFIEAKEWRLATDCDHIFEIPSYTQMVKSAGSKFDHLPVYGIIERVI